MSRPNLNHLRNRTLVVVSTQDWDDLVTRKQRFARRFAEAGCRVLYVEAQWHWLTYVKQHRRARVRLRRSGSSPRLLANNLWIWTPPPQLPFAQIWEPLAGWNSRRLWPPLRDALSAVGHTGQPLLYLYTPYNSMLVDLMQPERTVYECVDDFTAAQGLVRAETVARLETATLDRSDACVVTSPSLAADRTRDRMETTLIPNAVDVEHFASACEEGPLAPEYVDISSPRLGFLGAVNYWIDCGLLADIARARPDWQLVLVGPVNTGRKLLAPQPNIHLLGRQPYAALPDYVRGFDVCLNPYVMDRVAEGCSPLKLYEYLASGKPVVSVPMPEALQFAPPVHLAGTADEFVSTCAELLDLPADEKSGRSRRQQEIARAHSWDNRFDRTVALWESLWT